MKVRTLIFMLFMAFLTVLFISSPLSAQQKQLSQEQQDTFLSSRTVSAISGTFDSLCSFLYATQKIAIHTNNEKIDTTPITPTFPTFYKPTWKEFFDLIAAQSRSKWSYNPDNGYWVFYETESMLPYRLATVPGWEEKSSPFIINYIPPKLAPVGLDVYWFGTYSVDDNEDTSIFTRVRDAIAMKFIEGNIKDACIENMTTLPVGEAEALYFKTTTDSNVVLRQWVIIDKGQAFLLVSAIKPEHEKELLPDVLEMVNSFKVMKINYLCDASEMINKGDKGKTKVFNVDSEYGTLAFKGKVERTDTGDYYKYLLKKLDVVFLPGQRDSKGYIKANRTDIADLKTCQMVATTFVGEGKPYKMLHSEYHRIDIRLTEYGEKRTLEDLEFLMPKEAVESATHVGLGIGGGRLFWPVPTELK